MGILSNRVDISKIRPGDHIYTYRAAFTYSHHGIYAGGYQVIHFTPEINENSNTASSSSFSSSASVPLSCPNILRIPHCGIRQPGSGVVLSCLDCFLGSGSLYCFDYGVSTLSFLLSVRGGTCTTANSDPSNKVLHRAMYLLLNGFGKYDLIVKNCEDFALYCKTSLLISHILETGTSGQASSVFVSPVASFFPLKFLISSSVGVGVAVATAGCYLLGRYVIDIGVRPDVTKVPVENFEAYLKMIPWKIERASKESMDDSGGADMFKVPRPRRFVRRDLLFDRLFERKVSLSNV